MRQTDDLSKSLTPFVQGNTLIAVIELSLSSWLVAGVVPGVTAQRSFDGQAWRHQPCRRVSLRCPNHQILPCCLNDGGCGLPQLVDAQKALDL